MPTSSPSASPRREPIAVVGGGWVGLVAAACFAELGHTVRVCEADPRRLSDLRAGRRIFYEPGLFDSLARQGDRVVFTASLAEAVTDVRFVFVCVGTPPTPSGAADLSAVWAVVEELASIPGSRVLVVKSTVPVGTGQAVRRALDRSGRADIGYVSNPEFLAEGTAIRDFMAPDRVVVGSFDAADADAVAALWEHARAPVLTTRVSSAEMIKLASNAFLATKISFINEIANVCDETGADVAEVASGMGLDRRIGRDFLRPGLGYGGSCFPKDVRALQQLAGTTGYDFSLLSAVLTVNERQKDRVVEKLRKHLGTVAGARIAVLGLAFKPNTDDVREAPGLVLAARLAGEGAEVIGWDPVAVDPARAVLPSVRLTEDLGEAIRGADAAVIATEWAHLRELATRAVRESMRTPLIVDGRNMLDPTLVENAGFRYEAVGRPPAEPAVPAQTSRTKAVRKTDGEGSRLPSFAT